MIPRERFQPSATLSAAPSAAPSAATSAAPLTRITSRAGQVAAWVIVALVALDLLGAALALTVR